ncbi:MAG: hypothetical protein WAM13_21330, partial [Candidatus Sulfotelmatobacter sp.]
QLNLGPLQRGVSVMDIAQAFIFYAEWIFFVAWGALLAAVSVVAFGSDLVPSAQRAIAEKERR